MLSGQFVRPNVLGEVTIARDLCPLAGESKTRQYCQLTLVIDDQHGGSKLDWREHLGFMSSPISTIQVEEIDLTPILGVMGVYRVPPSELHNFVAETHALPDTGNLLMQMFYVFLALGLNAQALEIQADALKHRRLFRLAGTKKPTIRLLALMGPGDMIDNAPLEFVVDGSDIQLDLMYLLPGDSLPASVPEHDVMIVAIGESDKNHALLAQTATWVEDWPRPVLNRPEHVMLCARDKAYALLHDIPGLHMGQMRRLGRPDLASMPYPCLIRPIDTQGGVGLEKLNAPADLHNYLTNHLEDFFYVSSYIDYASEDGQFRKLRIALIDGTPYLCHLAISDHWMVHYNSAGMAGSASKRSEEAALMNSFEHDFAVRHGRALQAVASRLGLAYVIVDCAETRDGRLLVFEVDSRACIHATDPIDLFPYKPKAMRKVFDGFRAMLLNRMGV